MLVCKKPMMFDPWQLLVPTSGYITLFYLLLAKRIEQKIKLQQRACNIPTTVQYGRRNRERAKARPRDIIDALKL